ncbi:hypothetical protein FO519_009113, partial [Halicephalobus sp. NKZ332]
MGVTHCWSRNYFTEQSNGKFKCIFCSTEYTHSATKFKYHLHKQCKNIGPEARAQINKLGKVKLRDESAPKRARIDDLPAASSSTSHSISHFLDRIDIDDQDQLDILLTR